MKVPGNGSCLFNSITLAMENTTDKAQETRDMVSSIIKSEPYKYTQSFLATTKTVSEYAEWIKLPSSWGG